MRACLVLLAATHATACSNAAMEDAFGLSIRTEDLGDVDYEFVLVTQPRGRATVDGEKSKYGFVGFLGLKGAFPMALNASQGLKAGMNEAGLSCDKQTLKPETRFAPAGTARDLDAALLCRWALESFGSVAEVEAAIAEVNVVVAKHDPEFLDGHYAFRDRDGRGAVVEFVAGAANVYRDDNDGENSFGIMTNEPEWPWQVQNVKHAQWKLGRKDTPALSIPGDFYPDARFLRLWLHKSTMVPRATTYRQAVADAVAVLNTVTVPRGTQPGKDAARGRTHWGVVWDHKNSIVYWRSESNMQLQRLRLEDADLGVGGARRHVPVESAKLPFFADASAQLLA